MGSIPDAFAPPSPHESGTQVAEANPLLPEIPRRLAGHDDRNPQAVVLTQSPVYGKYDTKYGVLATGGRGPKNL